MSKVRNYRGGVVTQSKKRLRTGVESLSKITKLHPMEGTHLYDQTRCHTIDSDNTQLRKESLYNKHIS